MTLPEPEIINQTSPLAIKEVSDISAKTPEAEPSGLPEDFDLFDESGEMNDETGQGTDQKAEGDGAQEAEAPADARTSASLEQIAKRELELLKLKDDLEQKQKLLERHEQLRELAKSDPRAVVDELGVDLDGLARQLVEQPKQEPTADDKVEELRQELEKRTSQLQEVVQQQQTQRRLDIIGQAVASAEAPVLQLHARTGTPVAQALLQQISSTPDANLADVIAQAETAAKEALVKSLTVARDSGLFSDLFGEVPAPNDAPATKATAPEPEASQTQSLSQKLGGSSAAEEKRELTPAEEYNEALRILQGTVDLPDGYK